MPTDVRALFERETREVLTEPYGKPPDFLVLQTRCVTARAGLGYALVSGLTMGGLNLFGFPWAKYQYVVDVQLEVRNLRRELVGTYRGQGPARATGGLSSSTNYAQPDQVLYLQCVRQGFDQLLPLAAHRCAPASGRAAAPGATGSTVGYGASSVSGANVTQRLGRAWPRLPVPSSSS